MTITPSLLAVKAALPCPSDKFLVSTRNSIAETIIAREGEPTKWTVDECGGKTFLFISSVCNVNGNFYVEVYNSIEVSSELGSTFDY